MALRSIEDRGPRTTLSRLARFSSASGIAPEVVNDAVFAEFANYLHADTLARDPAKSHTRAIWGWNTACATVAGFPGSPAIYRLFKKRLVQLTGHDLTLHDARRIIATSIAIYDPANVAVASQALGHVNERVTQAHYNLATGIEASRQMASMIRSMRKRQ